MKKNKSQKQEVNNVLTLKQVFNNEVDLSDADKIDILTGCYEENDRRFRELETLPPIEQKLGMLYVSLLDKKLVKEIKYCVDRNLDIVSKFDTLTEEQNEIKEDSIVLLGKLAKVENNADNLINMILDDYIKTFGIEEKN